jgi:sugar transferase (PEP-CTERM system associated)
MIRLFKHYVPSSLLLLGLLESLTLFACAEFAWRGRMFAAGLDGGETVGRLPQLVTFALLFYIVMLAVGLYQGGVYRSVRQSALRLAVAFVISLIAAASLFYFYRNVEIWRSVLLLATIMSFFAILSLRLLFGRLGGWHRLRRRILVLGAGERAKKLLDVASTRNAAFKIVQFIRMTEDETTLQQATSRDDIPAITELVDVMRIDEVVLAMDERRGSLPVASLLETKMMGTTISELSTFLEGQTGRVDLESVSPSWFIFSDGFRAGQRVSILTKRIFDVLVSGLLLLTTAPFLIITAIAIKLTSKGPIFYAQERVGQFGQLYKVLKFRSMSVDAEKDGKPKWAAAGDARVTPVGRIIRASRIDEIPQIMNVFRGDMSFVGPRPERPFFVDQLTRKISFYAERHVVKPGITGWAQINYPYGASIEDARHKLEYDLYYVKNYSIFLDLLILIQTVRVVLWQDGVR